VATPNAVTKKNMNASTILLLECSLL